MKIRLSWKSIGLKLILVLLLFSHFTMGQENNWMGFSRVTSINAITFEGSNVWFGTNGGLVRLNKTDGNMIYYNRSNSSIPSNNLNAISIDIAGNKWIATANGLAKFNNSEWRLYTTADSKTFVNHILAAGLDHKGNLWIGSNYGLSKYDGNCFIDFNCENSPIPQGGIKALALDDSSNIWVGALRSTILKYDGSRFIVFNFKEFGLPECFINCVIIDNYNNKWIGTDQGLIRYDGNSWKLFDVTNSNLPDNNVTSIAIDKYGNKWIGTYKGLVKYNDVSWELFDRVQTTLPSNKILCVSIDQDDNKWIGTTNGAAVFLENSWKAIKTTNNSLKLGTIAGLETLNENTVIICNYNQDVVKYRDGIWAAYKFNVDAPEPHLNGVQAFAAENNGVLWVGKNDGLYRFENGTWLHFDTSNSGLLINRIFEIGLDKNNNKWFGTLAGLFKYDGTRWTYYNENNSPLRKNVYFTSIKTDNNNNIWLGTLTGLYKFNGREWETNNLIYRVHCIAIDKENRVWIGADNGIKRIEGLKTITYNIDNSGLPSNWVNTLKFDKDNNLWAGTDKGLVKYDGSVWKSYTVQNSSLIDNHINFITADTNNNIWAGFISLNVLNEKNIKGINKNEIVDGRYIVDNGKIEYNNVITKKADKSGAIIPFTREEIVNFQKLLREFYSLNNLGELNVTGQLDFTTKAAVFKSKVILNNNYFRLELNSDVTYDFIYALEEYMFQASPKYAVKVDEKSQNALRANRLSIEFMSLFNQSILMRENDSCYCKNYDKAIKKSVALLKLMGYSVTTEEGFNNTIKNAYSLTVRKAKYMLGSGDSFQKRMAYIKREIKFNGTDKMFYEFINSMLKQDESNKETIYIIKDF